MSNLAITPKRLGQIQLETYCPRCFWYLLRLRFKAPFDHFGGAIFKSTEQMEMAVVDHLLKKNGCLPKEFTPFCDLKSRVAFPRSSKKFRHEHESGVMLYGEPDDIFYVADGSIAVIDHKTAQNKEGQDDFLPCYEVQCIGYAYIAEFGFNYGKCSKAGLFYWEIQHEEVKADPGKFYWNKQLSASFVVKPHAIKVDYTILDPLIDEAQSVWDAKNPPEGSSQCKDCEQLDLLFGLQNELLVTDRRMTQEFAGFPHIANPADRRILDYHSACHRAMKKFRSEDFGLPFADDGMVAAWGDV